MSEKHTCCGRVWAGHSLNPCGVTAKFERDGKWYCKRHDPVNVAAKLKAKTEKYEADYAARQAENAKHDAERKETQRRADCYDDLLEALTHIEQRLTHLAQDSLPVIAELKLARAAIFKATGEQA